MKSPASSIFPAAIRSLHSSHQHLHSSASERLLVDVNGAQRRSRKSRILNVVKTGNRAICGHFGTQLAKDRHNADGNGVVRAHKGGRELIYPTYNHLQRLRHFGAVVPFEASAPRSDSAGSPARRERSGTLDTDR